MGQRILKVSDELIRQVLLLPETCKVLAVSADYFFNEAAWALKVESPDFPDVPPGGLILTVGAMYERADGKPVFVGWHGLHPQPESPCDEWGLELAKAEVWQLPKSWLGAEVTVHESEPDQPKPRGGFF